MELESWASVCMHLESTGTIYSLQSRSTCVLERSPHSPTRSELHDSIPDGGRPGPARSSLEAHAPPPPVPGRTRSGSGCLPLTDLESARNIHQQASPARTCTLTRVNGSINIYDTFLMRSACRISSTSDWRFLHKKPFIWGEGLDGEWGMQAAERSLLAPLCGREAGPSLQQPRCLNLKGRLAGSCHLGLWA